MIFLLYLYNFFCRLLSTPTANTICTHIVTPLSPPSHLPLSDPFFLYSGLPLFARFLLYFILFLLTLPLAWHVFLFLFYFSFISLCFLSICFFCFIIIIVIVIIIFIFSEILSLQFKRPSHSLSVSLYLPFLLFFAHNFIFSPLLGGLFLWLHPYPFFLPFPPQYLPLTGHSSVFGVSHESLNSCAICRLTPTTKGIAFHLLLPLTCSSSMCFWTRFLFYFTFFFPLLWF